MRIRKLALAATAACTLVGLSTGVAAAAPPSTSDGRQQLINSRGSDTTFGIHQRLANIYNGSEGCNPDTGNANQALRINCLASQPTGIIETENYDHDTLAEHDPYLWGSSRGVTALCNQESVFGGQPLYTATPTELARSSRAPGSSDCAGLIFHGFARDGLIPVNWRNQAGSPAAGVTNLTQAQLQGIFRDCTITNWSQLGGANAPIEVWGVQTGSGTYQSFNIYVGGNTPAFPNGANSCVTPGDPDGAGPLTSRVIQENDAAPIFQSDTDRNAVWWMSFGPWNTNLNLRGSSSRMNVNGITASGTTIVNGTFPISRFLYMVTDTTPPAARAAEHQAALGFANWVCKNDSLHTTATGKQYATLITQAYAAEGFYRNAANAGGAGTTCVNLTT
jgi:ABC-type phosphate transport system substrate-binding protein